MMSNPAIIISQPASPPAPHLNPPLPLLRLIKRTSTWVLSGEDYGYDPNGNLIYDRHRKITAIAYNAIDRPAQIRFLQGDTISYIYTATGEKLAEISRSADGLSDLRRDYYGPFEFINGSLDRTNYPQGYMDYYGYFYAYIPDYQGNILGIYNAATGWLDQFTDYYPYGQPHPDCTSPELNRRKFGAKELSTTFSLNEYDFAARRLSPLGLFTQPDPLAGSLTDPQSGDRLPQPYLASISPYSYCAADPINLIDPTGLNPIYDEMGNFLGCTKEGFTGLIYIYTGDESIDFSKHSIYEIFDSESSLFGQLSALGGIPMSNTAVERILNHILSYFNGTSVFGHIFNTNLISGGHIVYNDGLSEDTTYNTRFSTTNSILPQLSFKTLPINYSATVENIVCSLIIHEWLGHGVYHFADSTHYMAYVMVAIDDVFFPNTTRGYKVFIFNNIFDMLFHEKPFK